MKTPILLSAALLLLAACGNSQPEQPKGPISEDRSAAFKSMMPDFMTMGKMVKGEETYEVEKFKQAAATFAANSKKPFDFFQTDPQGNGEALPAIWEKPADFTAAQQQFEAAVAKLSEAAQTADLQVIKAAYGEVGASCKSCHDSFRMPKQ
ncbi:cytochrome c [Neisseria sp. ZJ106]|uniref:Cytochrome c n=1 Tax=Neisseria lisongii TaxID=2912188 RepID=A0AAW5AN23_9NEIS|nr:cytochrome c [Neisseria lisongii]MCF7521042.1 cytochrome c [Neisseria lisongii]MCF7528848.1 cytochrome c [Neisseria lisongii]WCL72405.1 cytochrome c [Neisseria lisongii]